MYQLKKNKKGEIVPIIDGVYLHSFYDPKGEAQEFINSYREQLRPESRYLVLGLGFGYHTEALSEYLGSEGDIVIIEPNKELVDDYVRINSLKASKVLILNPKTPQELYSEPAFINFLIERPTILKHDKSFEVNLDFFRKFLEHKPSQNVKDYEHLLSQCVDPEIKNLNGPIWERINEIKSQTGVKSKSDFGLLALETFL